MKKILAAFIIACLIISSCASKKHAANDSESKAKNSKSTVKKKPIYSSVSGDFLKANKVKTISKLRYKYINGKPEKKPVLLEKITYDEHGREIEKIAYMDISYSKTRTFYSAAGNIAKVESYDKRDKKIGFEKYKTDKKGNITEKFLYDKNGKPKGKIVYRLDKKGNIIEQIEYDSKGKEEHKSQKAYDKDGFLIAYTTHDLGKTVNWKYEYICDNKGRVKEIRDINQEDNYRLIHKFNYNDQNKLTEEKHFSADGKLQRKSQYEYDENNNKIKEIKYDKYGKPVYVYSYIFKRKK